MNLERGHCCPRYQYWFSLRGAAPCKDWQHRSRARHTFTE